MFTPMICPGNAILSVYSQAQTLSQVFLHHPICTYCVLTGSQQADEAATSKIYQHKYKLASTA